jgi:sensor histidine kinase YesM
MTTPSVFFIGLSEYQYLNSSMKKNLYRILQHVAFWIMAWLFLSWFFSRITREFYFTPIFTSLLLLIAMGTTYVLNYCLIPSFLLKKRYFQFIAATLFTFLISLWMELLGILGIFLYLLTQYNSVGRGMAFFIDPVFLIAGLYLVVMAGAGIHLVRNSFRLQDERHSLENRQLTMEQKLTQAELNQIKSQFHPHFLFNTLNNLYWLTLNKSDEAPSLILKISDLLDYSLYRCNQPRVTLSQEIDHIRNYLDIIKIRFQESAQIRFSINGSIENTRIAPLLLLPLVENACKHGVTQSPDQGPIDIQLETQPGQVHFRISNDYLPVPGENTNGGIGLSQLKTRLSLEYPDRHTLTITQTNERFTATLFLQE